MAVPADAMHPGELLAEILEELGLSQAAFARAIGVSRMRVSHLVAGSRPMTAELALLVGKALGQSPEMWINLQMLHDLCAAQDTLKGRIKGVKRVA